MHQNMDIDASTIGNHELYDNEVINHIADHVYPKMNKTYLSGNARYKDDTKKLSDLWVVKAVEGVGNVLIVGFLYNFKGHGTDCVVDDVEATLNDNKYAGIIAKTNPVLIIGVLHSPPEEQETKTIQEKLAALTDNLVPIILLCGHDHKQHSDITTTKGVFESKCFFEMLSDIEFDLNPANSLTNSQFQLPISSSGVHILNPTRSANSLDRSFVISNLAVKPLETSVSAFQQRANIKPAAWETEKGKQIREATDAKAKELGLSSPLGCAPQTYYGLFKMPLETKKNVSLYTLYVNEIYPKMNPFPNPKKKDADKKTSLPSVVYIMNSASIRSHLYKGEIYRDDIYSVEPFTNNFAAIRDISLADMRKLITYEATTGASNGIKNVTQKSCWKKCISTKEMGDSL
ncbi:putative phosphoprotein phosphatase [Blattamonas nauphoetae]|uniref:Phosphoprotein phosphatase n=1 Tax=Blattamonas nauphoetae TaxID=2049346 RepID=A0ABQ9Y779_9EUKA|nr:putative phosphoprotein phosphatase [Blattamonas nauphoetae]